MTTKADTSQEQRDQELLDILPARAAFLTAIAAGGSVLLGAGLDPRFVAVFVTLAGAYGAYIAAQQRTLQRRVDAYNAAKPSAAQRQQIDRKQEQLDGLRTQLDAANAMIATLRKEYDQGDTQPAYAAERIAASEGDGNEQG